MEFNTGHFSEEKIDVENKMHGLEITPVNTKLFDHQAMALVHSVLIYETPKYVRWNEKSQLKKEFEKEL